LTEPVLRWRRHGERGSEVLDVLMVVLTVVAFGVLFALIAGLERV
jgi:hypothetical protein